jgi:hypothetical protein
LGQGRGQRNLLYNVFERTNSDIMESIERIVGNGVLSFFPEVTEPQSRCRKQLLRRYQSRDDMICQLCLTEAATQHVTERAPCGRFEVARYCAECYEAKFFKPPPSTSGFPRPRLTLKNIMILVGVWAIPNAVVAWVMRSGYVTGTAIQMRQWTRDAFLAVNLVLGFFVVWFGLMIWLFRVMWYKRTGGLVTMPVQKLTREQYGAWALSMVPILVWLVVATFLERWLTPKIWPIQRHSAQLLALIECAGVLPIVALRLWKNHEMRDRIRQEWRAASGLERALRAVAVAWTFGFFLAIVLGGPGLAHWGFVLWFPIPPAILIGIVVQLALMAAVALSIRRR